MPATTEQQQLTEVLLQRIEDTAFPSAGQLDRIERLISTRDELGDYIDILTQKVEDTRFPDRQMIERIERLVRVLQRFDLENGEER